MSMSRTVPASSHLMQRSIENEKKYKKALRAIYKYGQETNKLTEEALEACRRQGINIEELELKTAEDFAINPKQDQKVSLKNVHQVELLESEANLSLIRFNHHEKRRKSQYCIHQSPFDPS